VRELEGVGPRSHLMREENDSLLALKTLQLIDSVEHDVMAGPAALFEGDQSASYQKVLRADHHERVLQLAARSILIQ
jgi:hypothetical protein